MSRYEQASHVFWRCQYHIVWTPKYRFRILKNNVGKEVYRCIQVYCSQLGCIVDSVGINEEIIRRYVRHQEKVERQEQAQLELG